MKKLLFSFLGLILCIGSIFAAEVTVTKTVEQLTSMHGWEDKSSSPYNVYPNFALDENGIITISATGSSNGTLSSKRWFTYQNDNNGEFSISAACGYKIKSVGITNVTSSGGGDIVEKGTSNILKKDGTQYSVNKKSVTLCISYSGTNAMMRITQFSVVYEPILDYVVPNVTIGLSNVGYVHPILNYGNETIKYSSSNSNVAAVDEKIGAITPKTVGTVTITATGSKTTAMYSLTISKSVYVETFKNFNMFNMTTDTKKAYGDNGIHYWAIKSAQRAATDTIMGYQGVQLQYSDSKYNSYINEDNLEGGIKHLSFYWRAVSSDKAVDFEIDDNGQTSVVYRVNNAAGEANTKAHLFDENVDYPKETRLRFKMLSLEKSNIVVGPYTITPYLFFTNKTPSVNCNSAQSFDLNTILINNTSDTKPAFAVTSNNTGGTAATKDGVIDLRDVLSDGSIDITASWGNVSTTTTLSVTAKPVPTAISLNGGNALVVSMGNRFQISSSLTPANANPNLTWSVEPTGVVEIDQNGVINVVGTGTATVTATSKANTNVKGTCAITAAVNNYTSFIDTIKAAVTTDDNYHGTTSPDEYAGDNGIFRWVMRGYRRNVNKGDKMDDNAPATRLSYNNASGHVGKNYIAYDTPYEGGVKRISFQWKAANSVHPVSFNVDNNSQPDGNWMRYETYLPASSANTSWNTYTRDVNMDKNVQFRITIPKSDGVVLTISPLTITPYLLYTTKSVSLTKEQVVEGEYKYTNNDIINNTGVELTSDAISYSISGDAKIAIIKDEDKHTGKVTILGKGTVTVTATWGDVTTSYQLTISDKLDPVITLANPDPVDVFGSYSPAPVVKIGNEKVSYAVTYSSDNDKVAKVESNKIVITGVGEAVIQAKVPSSDFYNLATKSVPLNVTKPATTVAWNESFTNSDLETTEDNYNQETKSHPFNGKNNVLKWQVRNYQFNKANANKVNGEDGIRIKKDGNSNNYIATNSPNEGGVKAVYFNWRMPMGDSETSKEANFTVSVGPTTPIYSKAITSTANKGEYYPFVEEINCKSNQTFKITINADGKATIFGPVTIKPYLLYTNKTIQLTAAQCAQKGYKFTNQDLIDNTDDHKITYAISGDNNDKIAKLNTSTGEVNLIGKGKVTITAKWNNNKVTTSYTLEITEALTPTVELATPEPIELDGSYTPQPVAKFGDYVLENTAFTYTSSNPNVASVSQDGKTITIQGPGSTTIRAILTASAYYNTAYTDVTLTVNDYTPEDGTFFEEKFTNVPASTSQYVYNTEKFEGDKKFTDDVCLYKWEVYNYRSSWSGTKIALRNRENDKLGYLKMDGNFEGGIKFIAFDWKSSSEGGDVNYSVKVNEKSVPIRVPSSTSDMYRFAHFFDEISDEVNLNIQMDTKSGAAAYLAICPVTIMPYLLYTRKAPAPTAQSLVDNNYKFENTEIINNTGAELSSSAITFAIVGENEDTKKIATIDPNTGVVTCHGAGKVTVKATWKPDPNKVDVVTTTYELTVPKLPITVTYPNANINVTQNIPLPVATLGDVVLDDVMFTYSTSKETVIEIKDGMPALVATGKAKITATLNDDRYTSEPKTAEITVTAPPAEKCFVETFDKLENKGTSYTTSEETFNGKDDVYRWKVVEYRNSDAFGIRIRRDATNHKEGCLSMNGNQEGGIKYVTFKWQSTSENPGHFVITVNGTEYDYPYSSTKLNKDYTWERAFNAPAKDNNFSITVKEDSKIFIMVQRAVTIVPYLLYTVKTKEIKIGETYTNNNLIDNRDNAEKIEYSVKEGDTYASVDEKTGEVTGLKEGTATIQAKWGEVITTYQVTVSKDDEITLDEEKDNSVLIEGYAGTENMTVNVKRKLSAGKYNTFCVPFEISKTDLQTALKTNITKLVTLDESQPGALVSEGGQMNLNIAMTEVTEIAAGKPYLIEIDKAVDQFTIEGVEIVNVGKDDSYFQSSDKNVTFYGITSKYLIPNSNQYLFMSNNRLSWNNSGAAALMKGLRSYFHADVENPNQVAARLVFNQPQTPTTIETPSLSGEGWGEASKVIINNQLIIIRGGKMYNAMGAEL